MCVRKIYEPLISKVTIIKYFSDLDLHTAFEISDLYVNERAIRYSEK